MPRFSSLHRRIGPLLESSLTAVNLESNVSITYATCKLIDGLTTKNAMSTAFAFLTKNCSHVCRPIPQLLFCELVPEVHTVEVAYLRGEGAQCDAPLWPDHENFLQATLYEKVRFLPFFSKNCKIQQCLMVFCVSKFQKNGRMCGFH